jgi:DNA polymerase III delta subunit
MGRLRAFIARKLEKFVEESMRFDNALNFIRQLNEGKISASNYLIICPNISLRMACEERLLQKEREVLENPDKPTLYQALNTSSLFAKSVQLVINFTETPTKEVLALLEKPRQSQELLVTMPKLPSSSPLITAYEVVLTQGEMKGWELEAMLKSWLLYGAEKAGIQISDECALDLAKRCDLDIQLLKQEWNKLVTYIGDRRSITKEDIQTLSPHQQSRSLWLLNDACIKKSPRASQLAQQLLDEGVSPIAIVRMLRGQYQTLLQMQQLPKSEIASRFPYLKGRILDQQLDAAKNIKDASKFLILIDEMECKLKSSSVSDDALLDLLIAQLIL